MLKPHELSPELRAEMYASLMKSHARLLQLAKFNKLTKGQAEAWRRLAAERLIEAEQYKPQSEETTK